MRARSTLLLFPLLLAACSSKTADAGDAGASSDLPPQPPAGGLTFTADATTVTLHLPEGGDRLVIRQEGGEVAVVVDGTAVRIPGDLDPASFSGLTPGPATWELLSGDEPVADGEIVLIERFTRQFELVIPDPVAIENLSGPLAVGDQRTIAGTAQKALRAKLYIGRPSGPVDVLPLSEDSTLPAGTPFSIEYAFDEPGLYAVELVLTNGLPAANVPVYVGGGLPLVLALLDAPPQPITGEVPVAKMDTEMLGLVNTARVDSGLAPVVFHPQLQETAQTKADDMAARKYFGHTDPDGGNSVRDLAEAAGLTGQVSENIAVDYSAERAFAAWYWSPSHRASLFDERWRSHGLGVAEFEPQFRQLVFVQHFLTEAP